MLNIGAFLLVCTTAMGAGNDGVLVYFSTANCSACRTAEPVVRQLESLGTVVRHVDGRREPELLQRYGIRQFPTFVVVRGGREVNRLIGFQTLAQLRNALSEDHPDRLTNTSAQPGTTSAVEATLASATTAAPAHAKNQSRNDLAGAVLRAERATVRIRVYDGRGFGVGTGTIIDTHGEEALVLTCGHIFRDTKGKGRIEVDLFVGGRTQTISGSVVDYDADTRDIGLISIRPGLPVVPVPVHASSAPPQTGHSVFSYGCDYGADPTRRDTRIAAVNKFQGPQNIEISGAPVEGRSGGGLFDQNGMLVGVCNAADHQDDEGLYAGPEVIHWQLDRVDLTHLYRDSKGNQAVTATDLVAAATEPAVAPQGDHVPWGSPQPQSLANVSTVPQTNLLGADTEVICIVRSRNQPAAEPRVMTIAQPTPELLKLLEANGSIRR
jgi:thiol-disulfide isomerase/thioredoxin